jgi:hypothetical protein
MRTRLRSKVTLLLMLCAVLIAIPGAAALAQDTGTSPAPTIQSDKADYAPGELVTLTGSGWQPGESVRIFVNDDQGQTWNRIQDVTADASGNISDSFNLPNWFVAQYSVTATGTQSGTATTSFTDADVVYNPPRFPTTGFQSVAAGNNFSFNLNATKQGGGADPVVTGFAVEAVGGGSPTCGPPPSGTASTFPTSWVSTTQTFPKTLNSTTATTFPFTVAPPSNASPGFYQGVIKFMTSAGGRGPGTAVRPGDPFGYDRADGHLDQPCQRQPDERLQRGLERDLQRERHGRQHRRQLGLCAGCEFGPERGVDYRHHRLWLNLHHHREYR